MSDFLEIQTRTGWGNTLAAFLAWCAPQPGWRLLDVGCGPGLFPALAARQGCRAVGVDLSLAELNRGALHPGVAAASAFWLPFPSGCFDLVTASNLLFLLPGPQAALAEMQRVARRGGQVAVLNPSENLSKAAAEALVHSRGLDGLARRSLLSWAERAEQNPRWSPAALEQMFAAAGLAWGASVLRVGPGFARFVVGRKIS